MKNIKIQAPKGYEIDYENSTKENIILKKKAAELPTSVGDIKGRRWYINEYGFIKNSKSSTETINQVTTKERAEAFLALMQLVELRDAWNKASDTGWYPNDKTPVIINTVRGIVCETHFRYRTPVLHFKTEKLRDQFLEQFRDLIETAKELI